MLIVIFIVILKLNYTVVTSTFYTVNQVLCLQKWVKFTDFCYNEVDEYDTTLNLSLILYTFHYVSLQGGHQTLYRTEYCLYHGTVYSTILTTCISVKGVQSL